MKITFPVPAALALSLFSASLTAAPRLALKWDGEKLALDAESVPLSQVLQELSQQTGIQIAWTGALNAPASAHFAGVELMQALRELLSGLDYGIAGPPVTRVLIVQTAPNSKVISPRIPDNGSRPDRPVETSNAEPASPGAETAAAKLGAVEKASGDRDRAALMSYLHDGDAAVQASAFQQIAAQDKDAAVKGLLAEIGDPGQPSRLQALQMLIQSGQADQSSILGALRDAFHDPDPAFQAYAAKTLAGSGDPAAATALSDAFRAANAATKLMMIEQLAGSPNALSLLQEAASDPDQSVSAAAKALLNGSP